MTIWLRITRSTRQRNIKPVVRNSCSYYVIKWRWDTRRSSKGWFTLWHKHKHKPTCAEAVRCRWLAPFIGEISNKRRYLSTSYCVCVCRRMLMLMLMSKCERALKGKRNAGMNPPPAFSCPASLIEEEGPFAYMYTTATARTTPSKKCVSILLWNFAFISTSVLKTCPCWICYECV